MKYVKRILCVVLCLVLAACVPAGCSRKEEISPASSQLVSEPVSQAPLETYRIGLLQYADQPSLNTVREAFMSRLEEWGYDETKVKIDYQNAGGDAAKAESACKKFVEDGSDMIVAISTPAAQAAVKAAEGTETKVLFAAVEDPEKELPAGSGTAGTQSGSSVGAAIDLALQVDPGMDTLGLFYDPEDALSKTRVEKIRTRCEEAGIELLEATVSKGTSAEEASKAAASLCEKADCILTPMGVTVPGMAPALAKAARDAKKPWYAEEEAMVQSGALAAVSVDYTALGYQNADMAVQLMEGRDMAQVPTAVFEGVQTCINQTTLDIVKAPFPEEILSSASFIADKVN